MSTKVSMFQNAQNIEIKNSSVTVEVGTTKQDRLVQFLQSASLNAILNAGGRADEVRCYPGTREEVIAKIERWRDGHLEPDRRFLWLSGYAGAGKSAIAQTIAERGADSGIHAANFFFFRGDNTRNHAQPLVTTLVYQLIELYPSLHNQLADVLAAQPLAHTAAVGGQIAQLLGSPIFNICHSSSINRQIFLIIDGLDECDDEAAQLQILGALHTLVSRDGSPFRVFVASRTEPHLVMFFNKIRRSVESLFLSKEYRPEDDIRKFVITKFDEIKRTHYLAHSLSADWPSQTDIDRIVCKSSGQFIYAATVMRFIEYSNDSPALSLLVVQQIRAPIDHSPFAQLDALYSHVFAKARNILILKWAIGFHFMELPVTGIELLRISGYEPIDLQSLFADISAVAQFSIDDAGQLNVRFYHASLPDYLKDKSRSGVYHVDAAQIRTDICTNCLAKFHDAESLDYILRTIAEVNHPTVELSKALLDASNRKFIRGFRRPHRWRILIFTILNLYLSTDKALCGRILRRWLWFAYIHKFDPTIDGHWPNNTASYRYYERLRVTEKAKFVIKNVFSH